MANKLHYSLTGAELHLPGYVQSSDPGAVGTGVQWVDTTSGAGKWVLKVRNATNTAWEIIADPSVNAVQITEPGKVSGAALTEFADIPPSAGLIPAANLPTTGLASDTTVNITTGMTTAQIQAAIDAVPKNLNGKSLTFQFADKPAGYVTTAALTFNYFFGGRLYIRGNTSESGKHTNQAVVLDSTASGCYTMTIHDCFCSTLSITNIQFRPNTAAGGYVGLYMNSVHGSVNVTGCYVYGNSSSNGFGFMFQQCPTVLASYNYFNSVSQAIFAYLGTTLTSQDNSSTGTNPAYGLNCQAAQIFKMSNQPAATTAAEYAAYGGHIGATGQFNFASPGTIYY